MPQKINMLLDNSSRLATRSVPTFDANLAYAPAAARQTSNNSNTLNASIIGRIHSIKPGCGSCGRKI